MKNSNLNRKTPWGWYGKRTTPREPGAPKEKRAPRKLEDLSHGELEDKLDEAVSEYVRRMAAMDGGYVRCVTCGDVGHWKKYDNGHYVSRAFRGTRWNLKNLGVQCPHCNRFLGGVQHIMRAHLVKLHGEEAISHMEYEATLHGETRMNRVWMIEQIVYWRAELKRIRKEGRGE
ncbi:MAG: recombination protein NinG [Spirochaetes bacterium]|nr:recombination protein NinG [Spirochaetota bacterium]